MKIVVGSDHAGFPLKQEIAAGPPGGGPRGAGRGHPLHGARGLSRLGGSGGQGRGGGAGGARRAHLRQRGGRVGGRQQGARRAGRDLPRRLFGPPGGRARRHERAGPGSADHRRRPGPRAGAGLPLREVHARGETRAPPEQGQGARSVYLPTEERARHGYFVHASDRRPEPGGGPQTVRPVRLARLHPAQPYRPGRAEAPGGRRRPHGRDLEPRDLREGHRRQRRLPVRHRGDLQGPGDRRQGGVRDPRGQGHPGRGRRAAARLRPDEVPRRVREPGGRPGPGQRHRGHAGRGAAALEGGGPARTS